MKYRRVLAAVAWLTLAVTGSADTVRGVLVDESAKPIAGARLRCGGYAYAPDGKWHTFSLTAVSGANGSFLLTNSPSAPSPQVPMVIGAVLPNGHLVSLSLQSDNEKVSVSDHPVTLKVHVKTTGGQAISGAKISVEQVFGKWVSQPKPRVLYNGDLGEFGDRFAQTTDSRGMATISGLPSGQHVGIRVHKPGMVRFGQLTLLQTAGETSVEAALEKGAILAGKVLWSGRPIRGAKVTAWVLGNGMNNGFDTLTGPDGEYRIDDAMAGETHLDASPDVTHSDLVAKQISDLKLAGGGELDGLDFVLQRGILVSGRVRTVVSDQPVAEASVMLVEEGGSTTDVVTDSKGQFSATVLAGSLMVRVSEVDGRRIQDGPNLDVTVDAKHNPVLDLPMADVLVLPAIPHLAGTATDASGNPIAGATIRDVDSDASATTDSSGQFQFSDPTHPGERVMGIKGESASKTPTILADKTSVTIRLDSDLGAVEGRVVDDDGNPLAGVELSLGGKGSFGSGRQISDAQGRYRFDHLASGLGSFFLWGKRAGYGDATIQPIEVAPNENKALDPLKLALADGVIDGSVLEANGKPAAGVTVSAQTSGVDVVRTDDLGKFHLTKVPRGQHYLAAGRNNNFVSSTLARTGDRNVQIVLTTQSPKPIGVVHQDLPGKAAPDLRIAAWVDGKPIALKSLRGKIVVIDFWATNCGACVAALPRVQALADRYSKLGVVVVGIHETGISLSKLKAFVKNRGITYAIGLDQPDPTGLGASASEYQPKGWPTVYVVAPTGRIVEESNDVEDAVKAVETLVAKGK